MAATLFILSGSEAVTAWIGRSARRASSKVFADVMASVSCVRTDGPIGVSDVNRGHGHAGSADCARASAWASTYSEGGWNSAREDLPLRFFNVRFTLLR